MHKLYNANIITENIKSYLENMIFAVFFLTDLIVSLISKETFAYYYGVNKENMPKLYNFWIGFDIFMIVIMVSLTIRTYFGM